MDAAVTAKQKMWSFLKLHSKCSFSALAVSDSKMQQARDGKVSYVWLQYEPVNYVLLLHVDKSQLNVVFEPVICMLQFQRAMLSQDIDSIRHWYIFQHIKDNTDMLTRLKTWFSNGIMVKIYQQFTTVYKPINKKDYEVWTLHTLLMTRNEGLHLKLVIIFICWMIWLQW